mgnify:CR=1 FL=1
MAAENELIIFKGEHEREPIVLSLNGKIGPITVSPCKRFIAIGVKNQINIYEIRKRNNIVLFKNFSDLKIGTVTYLKLYEGDGPRLCFVDEKGLTGVIII